MNNPFSCYLQVPSTGGRGKLFFPKNPILSDSAPAMPCLSIYFSHLLYHSPKHTLVPSILSQKTNLPRLHMPPPGSTEEAGHPFFLKYFLFILPGFFTGSSFTTELSMLSHQISKQSSWFTWMCNRHFNLTCLKSNPWFFSLNLLQSSHHLSINMSQMLKWKT